MLIDIMNDSIEGPHDLAYDSEIQQHGGVEAVATHVCNLVFLDVKCLSGREVAIEMFQEVRKEQVNTSWKGAGGYLDLVTDDCSDKWLRFYVA